MRLIPALSYGVVWGVQGSKEGVELLMDAIKKAGYEGKVRCSESRW